MKSINQSHLDALNPLQVSVLNTIRDNPRFFQFQLGGLKMFLYPFLTYLPITVFRPRGTEVHFQPDVRAAL